MTRGPRPGPRQQKSRPRRPPARPGRPRQRAGTQGDAAPADPLIPERKSLASPTFFLFSHGVYLDGQSWGPAGRARMALKREAGGPLSDHYGRAPGQGAATKMRGATGRTSLITAGGRF